MRASRGVVLIHVLILMVLMAWIAAIVLNASLSRQVLTKRSTDSNSARAVLAAATASISACLSQASIPQIFGPPVLPVTTPMTDCTAAIPVTGPTSINATGGCLGTRSINGRPYDWSVCATPVCVFNPATQTSGCTCRFAVKVCNPGATTGVAPCTVTQVEACTPPAR